MNTTVNVLLNGKIVGTTHDFAERVVTDVFFNSELERAAFAVEARGYG